MAKLLTSEEFISQAYSVHGDKYNYALVEYKNSTTLVKIICKRHDYVFETFPNNHTHNKGGCPICRYEKSGKTQTGTLESFRTRAISIYGEKYDYTEVVYKNAKTKVKITCKEHDYTFYQTPDKHFCGTGCGKCVKNGYNKSKPGSLYLLQHADLIKIGITNRKVTLRQQAIKKSSNLDFEIIFQRAFEDGQIPMEVETSALRILREKYEQPKEKFDGCSECFVGASFNAVIKILNDEIGIRIKEMQYGT